MSDGRPVASALLNYFTCDGYPPQLLPVPEAFAKLAFWLVRELPDNPELVAGLLKLLEARDCVVRAAWEKLGIKVEPDVEFNTWPSGSV